jgi:7,8-dihydropterin-6-yl-methyl-4-(beta-D-ribofuranosyl)aminobenzene 5'-phosphate synthase
MVATTQPVDRVEVLTLQDNYIDIVARDDTEVVERARSQSGYSLSHSLYAEHGFSLLITVERAGQRRSLVFDFGYSPDGARRNADSLGVDLGEVEAAALSHGHFDHTGGLAEIMGRLPKGAELVMHPAVRRHPRFSLHADGQRAALPHLLDAQLAQSQVTPTETREPYPLLGGQVIFLGEVPRVSEFEQPSGTMLYEAEGAEHIDAFEDDTGLAIRLADRGLIVISGCAHSGIINTIRHAQAVTGEEQVHTVLGGFHLTGMDEATQIRPTVEALQAVEPRFVVPAHCTGRNAQQAIERTLPDRFVINMVGTRLHLG